MHKKKNNYLKVDGLGAKDIKSIRAALRLVWQRSHVRKLCVDRCIGVDGFSYCEKCRKKAPKVFIDHTARVGALDAGFIERLFTPSQGLRGLCKPCHDAKTRDERREAKALPLGRMAAKKTGKSAKPKQAQGKTRDKAQGKTRDGASDDFY